MAMVNHILPWLMGDSILLISHTSIAMGNSKKKYYCAYDREHTVVVECLTPRLMGSGFEPHWSHCVVSLLSTG